MTSRKALKWLGLAILPTGAAITAGIWVLLDSMCGNTVLAETSSPDGKYRAITFDRDCGATTNASTQVSVIRSWWYLRNTTGN
jgi:invasion protein IalB